jgi:hypothetical protein
MVADGEAGAQVLAEPMPAAQGGNDLGSFRNRAISYG